MLGEILAVAFVVVVAGFAVAFVVARFAYKGPCPRCGRPIRRGQLACASCGCCHSGPPVVSR